MIKLYRIEKTQSILLRLPDMSSLDAITRQLPNGYYSTFRTYDGCTRVLGLSLHLRRLYDPVTKPDVDASILRRQLVTLLQPIRPGEARVRVMMTKQGQVYVAIEPLIPLPSEVYENGVRVETTEIQRISPHLKSTAFISASDSERKHIAQEGIFEALLVKNGRILEGMTSNFFYVLRPERSEAQTKGASSSFVAGDAPHSAQRKILFTAQRDVLLGVTRKNVIHLARGRGLEVKCQALKLNQLSDVKEAFITSSSRGVVPVIQIDRVRVGRGRPGAVTRMLISAYDEYVLENAEKI
jgi:branched-chain amino acid aminotransferase